MKKNNTNVLIKESKIFNGRFKAYNVVKSRISFKELFKLCNINLKKVNSWKVVEPKFSKYKKIILRTDYDYDKIVITVVS